MPVSYHGEPQAEEDENVREDSDGVEEGWGDDVAVCNLDAEAVKQKVDGVEEEPSGNVSMSSDLRQHEEGTYDVNNTMPVCRMVKIFQ